MSRPPSGGEKDVIVSDTKWTVAIASVNKMYVDGLCVLPHELSQERFDAAEVRVRPDAGRREIHAKARLNQQRSQDVRRVRTAGRVFFPGAGKQNVNRW